MPDPIAGTDQLHVRAATVQPQSLDIEARTASAILSTGAATERPPPRPDGSWGGPWIEALDVRGANLDALRGAPVLTDHNPEVRSRIGSVVSARIERGAIVAQLKFSSCPEVLDLLRDIQEGVGPTGFFLGYRITTWRRD